MQADTFNEDLKTMVAFILNGFPEYEGSINWDNYKDIKVGEIEAWAMSHDFYAAAKRIQDHMEGR